MIPTAEEFLKTHYFKGTTTEDTLLEFAKLHVEEALKMASENVYHNIQIDWIRDDDYSAGFNGLRGDIDKDSILDAYPLTNIK